MSESPTGSTAGTNGLPRVVIAGGGIAGLEAALALHQLLPRRAASVTLVAAEPDFTYKPMVVAEPFSREPAERRALAPALGELGMAFVQGAVREVRPEVHAIELAGGDRLGYDLLVVAVGARARPALPSAETFWAARGDLPIDELLDRAGASPTRTLAFVVPGGCSWPLPLYELALMTRRRTEERGGPYGLRLRVLTPEACPLAIFGAPATAAVSSLLGARGIEVEPFSTVVEEDGVMRIHPAGASLDAGAVIALPVLEGPRVAGLPMDEHGFTPIDEYARVPGVKDVYAAGDGTTFPVKQGGIATQQADAAAGHIAARLGATAEPKPFEPVLRGQLITGPESLNLSHELSGGHGEGVASLDYLWWPPGKVAGRYLGPWLAGTVPEEGLEPPSRPLEVEVALPHEWHGSPMALDP